MPTNDVTKTTRKAAAILALSMLAGCAGYDHAPFGGLGDSGPIGGGSAECPQDDAGEDDPDTESETETTSDPETAADCYDEGGYCAEQCAYGFFASEDLSGCGVLEVCCLPYGDDFTCAGLPDECVDIGPDEDAQYLGCCWSNTVYWCDSTIGDEVQFQECAAYESCGYSYEEGAVWCL